MVIVAAGLLGAYLCCYQPLPVVPVQSAVPQGAVTTTAESYRDACVYSVTHPELNLDIDRVESPGEDCYLCRYVFRIWNQTAAAGTKAYKTRVLVVPQGQHVELNGRAIQSLKLYGLVTELRTIEYAVVRNQDYFVLEAPCPGCLFPEQRHVKFVVEYYECAGVQRFEVNCDLGACEVTVLRSEYERTAGNCCN